jgi:hypothetical protein
MSSGGRDIKTSTLDTSFNNSVLRQHQIGGTQDIQDSLAKGRGKIT